jgi:hypothetical protein
MMQAKTQFWDQLLIFLFYMGFIMNSQINYERHNHSIVKRESSDLVQKHTSSIVQYEVNVLHLVA